MGYWLWGRAITVSLREEADLTGTKQPKAIGRIGQEARSCHSGNGAVWTR